MARLRNGSGALSRDLNRASILELIGGRGPIARVDIVRELDLSPATVTVLTRELVEDGLVREVDLAPSNGGRPAIRLGLVGGAAHALGVKIAADRLTAVRVNLEGEPLEYAERPFDAAGPGVVDRLGDELAAILGSADTSSPRLLGVGLGVPGIVDAQSAGTVESPVLGWRSLPLGARLQERLGVPVLIDNDVNTLAVAERLYGRGRGVEHFLTITIGRGVGLGIVVGGELYRGARGGAGEWGHMRVVDDGPMCHCGKRGCLEALVSDAALVQAGRDAGLLSPTDDVDNLRELAVAGDREAQQIYEHAGATLGRSVAGLVNVLSPQLILVSGEGIRAWTQLQGGFETALRADLFEPLRDVAVEVEPWDDTAWARGAAALVLRATFSAPLYERHADDAVRARLAAPATSGGGAY
jgi:predicted NBD/HSP70 family sugar kinase